MVITILFWFFLIQSGLFIIKHTACLIYHETAFYSTRCDEIVFTGGKATDDS